MEEEDGRVIQSDEEYGSEGPLSDDSEHEGERREFLFMQEETKSRFTEYSMTSSVIRRNEQLTLLDERFEKVREPKIRWNLINLKYPWETAYYYLILALNYHFNKIHVEILTLFYIPSDSKTVEHTQAAFKHRKKLQLLAD